MLTLLPRSDQASYAALLREHDVGLALMYTPHPSLVPIEMAAAGMLTVTNTFENKTGEALAAISSNLIATEPTIEGVADGLRDAAAGAHDLARRRAGSGVNWSSHWEQSLDDALLDRILARLGAGRRAMSSAAGRLYLTCGSSLATTRPARRKVGRSPFCVAASASCTHASRFIGSSRTTVAEDPLGGRVLVEIDGQLPAQNVRREVGVERAGGPQHRPRPRGVGGADRACPVDDRGRPLGVSGLAGADREPGAGDEREHQQRCAGEHPHRRIILDCHRLRRAMIAPGPQVTVVIPNWNGLAWLEPCLDALAAGELVPAEVIVVDNGSTDGSREYLSAERPEVRVIPLGRNTGFAHAANRGLAAASHELVALVNTDVIVTADWLARMASVLAGEPRAASVACKMLSLEDPGIVYDAGDVLRRDGVCEQRGRFGVDDGRWDDAGPIFGACAGAALYRRDIVLALGGFDERYFAYLEDVDLALRLRLAGWSCRVRAGRRDARRRGLLGRPCGWPYGARDA